MKTRWQLHVERWSTCTACTLCERRKRVVLLKGQIPCTVLFLGEAPGVSEDVLGVPFVGPAGKLLDRIIKSAMDTSIRKAFTNLVACIPLDDDGAKTAEPEDESVIACSPRLLEIVEIAQPKLIVCVGKLATDWTEPGMKRAIKIDRSIPRVGISHPASIIRAPIAQQGLMIQRNVIVLRNAVSNTC